MLTLRLIKKSVFFLLVVALFLGLVACGDGGDNNDGGTTDGENTAPVANAGEDQDTTACATVMLDGSGSSDDDGDALTFSWSLSSLPAGSLSELSNTSSIAPSFEADTVGVYLATLTVNDGTEDSTADTVSITVSEPVTTVSFSSDIQPIFDTNCIICHAVDFSGTDASFMPLTSDAAYGNLVQVLATRTDDVDDGFDSIYRAKRCDSANSVLFQRVDVNRTGLADTEASMPLGSSTISLDDQDSIRIWIDEGALNN